MKELLQQREPEGTQIIEHSTNGKKWTVQEREWRDKRTFPATNVLYKFLYSANSFRWIFIRKSTKWVCWCWTEILKHSNRRQGKCSCPRSDSSPITCNTRDADFLPCLSPHQRQRWLHVHWFVRGGSNSHNSTQGNKIWIFFFFGKKTSLLSNRRDSGPGNEISTDTSTIPPSPPLRQQQKKKEPPEENTWKIKFVDSRKRNLDSNVDSSEALIPEHLSPQSPDAVGYVKRWTIFPRCHRRKTN